jgi:hypothetical protein
MSLRPMYEYKVSIEGRGNLEARLNLYGVHGWQLVSADWEVDTATFVFMRELQADATDQRVTPLPDLAEK